MFWRKKLGFRDKDLGLGDGELDLSLLGEQCVGFCCSLGMGLWLQPPLMKNEETAKLLFS